MRGGGIFGNGALGLDESTACTEWKCPDGWKLESSGQATPFCVPVNAREGEAIPTQTPTCAKIGPIALPEGSEKRGLLPDTIFGFPGQLVVFGGLALAGVALVLYMGSRKPVRVNKRRAKRNARRFTLNDADRAQWIDNDEGLYRWWKSSRMSQRAFIREHRKEIDDAILRAMGKK